MPTVVEDFLDTKVGGFLAGFGLVIGVAATIRFAPGAVITFVARRAATMTAKEIAGTVVQDATIGRVPILSLETPITSSLAWAISIFTAAWWAMHGTDIAIEEGKSLFGIKLEGKGKPDEASVAGESSFNPLIYLRGEYGRIAAHGFNGAAVDP